MKNYLFILIAFLPAAIAIGQQTLPTILPLSARMHTQETPSPAYATRPTDTTAPLAVSLAERTTGTGGGRWYDYADSVLTINSYTAWTNLNMWNDTTAWFWEGEAGPYYSADCESIGLILDPFASEWNNSAVFPNSEISVSRFDKYIIDSLVIGGYYARNNTTPAKAGVIDTLIVQFVSGNGGGTSDIGEVELLGFETPYYGINSVICMDMYYDAINNKAAGFNAAPLDTNTYKFLLDSSDDLTGAAFGPATMRTVYPRAGHAAGMYPDSVISYSVAAGSYVGISVSYKSGDTDLTHRYGNDTVVFQSGIYEYNEWQPLIWFAQDGSPVFPHYTNKDWTTGCFLRKGGRNQNHLNYNGDQYIPNWDLVSGSNASMYQFPAISFHVTCATCNTVGQVTSVVNTATVANKVNIYPNPAAGELNISYTLAQSAGVTITLTDMVGQIVAIQKMPDAATGNAVINTTLLPDGVYLYTVEANGERTSGRVAVAH